MVDILGKDSDLGSWNQQVLVFRKYRFKKPSLLPL